MLNPLSSLLTKLDSCNISFLRCFSSLVCKQTPTECLSNQRVFLELRPLVYNFSSGRIRQHQLITDTCSRSSVYLCVFVCVSVRSDEIHLKSLESSHLHALLRLVMNKLEISSLQDPSHGFSFSARLKFSLSTTIVSKVTVHLNSSASVSFILTMEGKTASSLQTVTD